MVIAELLATPVSLIPGNVFEPSQTQLKTMSVLKVNLPVLFSGSDAGESVIIPNGDCASPGLTAAKQLLPLPSAHPSPPHIPHPRGQRHLAHTLCPAQWQLGVNTQTLFN